MELLTQVRTRAGLTKAELARRAATSRPTVSAYESGAKSPTFDTASRLIEAAGFQFSLEVVPEFRERGRYRERPVLVPDALPRLRAEDAMALIELPQHVEWSGGRRHRDLGDRRDRARVYELVLREGLPEDVQRYVDPVLLMDLFEELVLPQSVRDAWGPIVEGWRRR
jgi:transcriptional regulator with XRE-family HTH domain